MERENNFTLFEGFSLIVASLLLHVYTGAIPYTARSCGNALWIAWAIAGIMSIGLFFLYYALFRMYPGKNIMEICKEIFGPRVSKMICLLFLGYFFLVGFINLKESLEVITDNTYSHTPTIVLAIAILAVSYIVSAYSVSGLARITSVSVPIFALVIAFILLMAYRQYEPAFLFPILGKGVKPILQTGFKQLTCYDGLLILSVFQNQFGEPKDYKKCGFWAVTLCSAMFVICTVAFCMTNPYPALGYSSAGLLDLAQSIYINRFFQRFESIFIIFVSMGKILVLCIVLLAMKRIYCYIIDMPQEKENSVLLPMSLILLGGTQIFLNWGALGDWLKSFMRSNSLFFTLGMLIFLLIFGFFKKYSKRGKSRAVRAVSLLLVCCTLAGILSGCNNIAEPDEEIFSIVMGYDKSDKETMRITVKVMPENKNSAGGSGDGAFSGEEGGKTSKIPDNIFTVDAPCNLPAAELINTVIPKHLSMLQVKMVVISEELAREDLDILITPIIRFKEIKPSISVVICRGTAEEFISAKTSELVPFLPLATEIIMKRNKGNASYMVRTLGEIYRDFSGNYGDSLVMYGGLADSGTNNIEQGNDSEEKSKKSQDKDKKSSEESENENGNENEEAKSVLKAEEPEKKSGENSIYSDDPASGYISGYYPGDIPVKTSAMQQIAGMAVLRGTKMVGTLNTHETAMFMIADGSFAGAVLTVRDPYIKNNYVVYYARNRQNNRVKTWIDEGDIAHIEVECFLKGELDIVQNTSRDYRDPEQRECLRQYTQEYLQEETDKLLNKLQKEYRSDALQLGRYMASNFKTIEQWEAFDWKSKYPDAEISIKVNFIL